LGFGISELEIRDFRFGNWNLGFGILDLEF
jgi:hypothetical protein